MNGEQTNEINDISRKSATVDEKEHVLQVKVSCRLAPMSMFPILIKKMMSAEYLITGFLNNKTKQNNNITHTHFTMLFTERK